MYDVLTTPRGPHPIDVFKAVHGPTLATWVIHRSRRKREMEVFQDYRRVPWRGERQAQSDPLRTTLMAVALDRELAGVPAQVRETLPRSGGYPVVTDVEEGPGPNPFLDPPENPDDTVKRLQKWDLPQNPSNWTDGPGGDPKKKTIWRDIFDAFTGNEATIDAFVDRSVGKQRPTVDEDGDALASADGRKVRIPYTRRPPVGRLPETASAPPPGRPSKRPRPADAVPVGVVPSRPPPIGHMGSRGGATAGGTLVAPAALPDYAAPLRPKRKRVGEGEDEEEEGGTTGQRRRRVPRRG